MTTQQEPRPDPRGPSRTVMSVDRDASEVRLELDCGHTAHCVTHVSYKVGRSKHCYTCGREALADWKANQGERT